MRRTPLPPPRPVFAEALPAPGLSGPLEGAGGTPSAEHAAGTVTSLGRPARANERRRPLFRPKRGWVRRFERELSRWLARAVFPYVPGLHLPYDLLLKRSLTLAETDIGLPGLPRAFDGLRALVVSDIHAGPFVSPGRLRRTLQRLMTLEPDVVLLPGDLITCREIEFDQNVEAFRALTAPLGVYAVLGNHDHYGGNPDALRRAVERIGIQVLHNRSVLLHRGKDRLALAGVDDLLLGEPELDAALDGAPGPVVLLSHNPDLAFEAARRNVALMISGHTHGGQVRVPGLPVLVRQSRYRLDEGRYKAGETELLVSRGLGAVGVPWRAGCPPEAVLLRLRARG